MTTYEILETNLENFRKALEKLGIEIVSNLDNII